MSLVGLKGLEFELKAIFFLCFFIYGLSIYMLNITLVLANEWLVQVVGPPHGRLGGREFDFH